MGIREISATERRRGSLTLVQVETRHSAEFAPVKLWQLTCAACDSCAAYVEEIEGLRAMLDHVCPDVPPCEEDDDTIMDQITTGGQF